MTQLRRGLYAQWFGVFLNEAQWAHSWPIKLLRASLHDQLSNSAAYLAPSMYDPQTPFSTVYDRFSLENWNFWQEYGTWDIPNTKNIVKEVMSELLQAGEATISPKIFKTIWYKISGQPQINLPSFQPPKTTGFSPAMIRFDTG